MLTLSTCITQVGCNSLNKQYNKIEITEIANVKIDLLVISFIVIMNLVVAPICFAKVKDVPFCS